MTASPPEGKERPTVSVCMPMARAGPEVEEAVRSVLAQELDDLEVLIGDETGQCEGFVTALGDCRVDYLRNPARLGFSANHVALLDRARGRYLAVLHDDDRWDPAYLARMVDVLEREPEVGLACCQVVLDRGDDSSELWPVPLPPGRSDDLLEVLLGQEWFMLLNSTLWRREVWTGPARDWPDLCCGDLQFFLSAAEARWPVYFLESVLATYSIHRGQSGAWRGKDNGLAVADDVLTFWDGWLAGRPSELAQRTALPRARWHTRRARALILAGRSREARREVAAAEALAGADLPELRRIRMAAALPNVVVRGAVAVRRAVTEGRLRPAR
jgi:glycosyltransferase involved in cell wall biosynthesis